MKAALTLAILFVAFCFVSFAGKGGRRTVAAAGPAPAATPTPAFQPGCKLPYDDIKVDKLAVDKFCGKSGSADPTSPNGLQNGAKNNFCAKGSPVPITIDTFDSLMDAVRTKKIPYGTDGLPASRSGLSNVITDASGNKLGEGKLVTFEGVVREAHHADTFVDGFGGENVNCNVTDLEWNDIHVALVAPDDNKPCRSVTAELSPHGRPQPWGRFATARDRDVFHVENGLPLEGARVRMTGPLFFDASHAPCNDPLKKNTDPARRSIWEIHPVYSIDIFDAVKKKWVAFDVWAKGQ